MSIAKCFIFKHLTRKSQEGDDAQIHYYFHVVYKSNKPTFMELSSDIFSDYTTIEELNYAHNQCNISSSAKNALEEFYSATCGISALPWD
jgi:hypothetical protein